MFEQPGKKVTREAAADLSAKQYCAVKLDSNGRVAAISAVTDKPYGILQNKPDALGVAAEIMIDGISQMVGGGNVAKGDTVGIDASGRMVAIVQGTDTTRYVLGTVLEDTDNADEIGAVQFDCGQPVRAS